MVEILNFLKRVQAGIKGLQNMTLFHHTRHEDGNSDEINVAGLSGELADPQNPKVHALTHRKNGTDDLESSLKLANLNEKSHPSLSNVTSDQHHPQSHTLASHSTKAHSELTGVSTSQHHVKTVASELNLADMAEKSHPSLSNVTSDQHHPQSHTLASHSTKAHSELTGVTSSQHHTKTVASELNLADMAEKSHPSLSNVTSDQHHPQSHTLASHSTKAHSELTGVSTSQHHVKTVASELNLADMAEKAHSSLTGITHSQHHTKFTIAEHDTTTRHPVAVIKTSQGSASGTLPPSNWALITMNVKSFFPGLSTPSGILHGYIMIGSQAASYTSQFAIYNDPACPPGAHDYDIRWYYLS